MIPGSRRNLFSFGDNDNAGTKAGYSSFKGVFITRASGRPKACLSGACKLTLLKLVILPPSRSLGTPEFWGAEPVQSMNPAGLTVSALLPNSCQKPVYNTSGR